MRPVSYLQLVRENRNFRLLWIGQIVSQLGDWFNFVTVQSLLLRLTERATPLAGLWIAQSLPILLLGPLAGVVVDRRSRKQVMIATDLARAAVALGFLAITTPETALLAYPLYAALATFSVFFEPARTAILPNVTREEELVTANALSAVTWSVILTSGAALGGVVAGLLGYRTAFLVNAASFLLSALVISRLRLPEALPQPARAGGFSELLAGLRYVNRRPNLAALLTVKMGWGMAGGIQLLIPIYGQQLFPLAGDRDGTLSFGLLLAISGAGTAIGPIIGRALAGARPDRMRWAIAAAFLLAGVANLALGSAGSFAAAGAALWLSRFGGSIAWVFSTVLLQLESDDAYRGRIFAAEGSLFMLAMMLSNLAVGHGIDAYAVPPFAMARAMGGIAFAVSFLWLGGLALARVRSARARE